VVEDAVILLVGMVVGVVTAFGVTGLVAAPDDTAPDDPAPEAYTANDAGSTNAAANIATPRLDMIRSPLPPTVKLRAMRTQSRASLVAVVALVVVLAACSSASHPGTSGASSTTTGAASSAATIPTPANLPVARVSPAAAQTIAGFGASGAWWPIDLAKFPAAVQREVGQMLFSPAGIELSGYRYNIGGGGVGVTQPDRAPKQYPADTAGLTFLQFASSADVPELTGFVNSAPPRFTTNGKSCGGNLKPGMEDAYAQYLAGVVRSLHDRDHITLKFVSPMNEPDDSFPDCGQEGMRVPVSQRAAVVVALGRELAAHAPWAKVIADETTADAILADEAPTWLAAPGAPHALAAIAHHTYDFPTDALRRLLPPIAKRFGVPTWMTEICCYKGSGGVASSFGAHFDPTMTQGFWLADQIDADLTVAGDSAWYWWTALSPVLGCDPKADPGCPTRVNTKGFNDGLLYYDQNGPAGGVTQIFTTKRFFVLGQFSRYVRPGAVRHDVLALPPGLHAMAFADGNDWTVVTWNESKAATTFGLALPSATRAATGAVITNEASSLATTALPGRTDSGVWLVHLPASTIATYTFAS
jgi:O-glycosyl hydrolase